MERKRLDEKPQVDTPLPHVRRATSMPAWTSPPVKSPHVRQKISDPSAGGDGETFSRTEGIGIGLSISRSIIEAHGGRLCASASTPHGAVFQFSLPVIEEPVS